MNHLLLIILFPVALSLVALIKGNAVKKWAFGASLLPLLFTTLALSAFNPNGGTQFLVDFPWIASQGIRFTLGLDGISML
jgi:NADH-quinone oxidoreductase subunit M